jgi:hypothetical protein
LRKLLRKAFKIIRDRIKKKEMNLRRAVILRAIKKIGKVIR